MTVPTYSYLMSRRPPTSTLFPYTTLFLSCAGWPGRAPRRWATGSRRWGCSSRSSRRSEEHTSELQSRFDVVCRLLLEKKKIIARSLCGLLYAHYRSVVLSQRHIVAAILY